MKPQKVSADSLRAELSLILKRPQVRALLGVSEPTFARLLASGTFPNPVVFGARVCWRRADVERYIANLPAGEKP